MQPQNLMPKLAVQTALTALLMGLALFGAAGRWNWAQGWAWLALFVVGSAGFGLWLRRRDPALLASRLSSPVQQGQPVGDRLFFLAAIPLWFGWMALMAVDAQRWHWSQMPPWLNGIGAAVVVLGFLGVLRVFAENSFAAPVVRVQAERAQTVIDTGPYARVRHPMYVAGLFYIAGLPLLLGSWLGLACVPVMLLGLCWRIGLEERTLQRDLPGYDAYMRKVRWRLMPGIW
jgi:protein-S-isoprenylcysteine O-methyltransferase Ste14